MYTVYFTDGTIYKGGDRLSDPQWSTMPNKTIKLVIYKFLKRQVLFEGFEAYNMIPIKAQALNAPLSFYSELLLMGRFKGRVYKITFDFINKKVSQSKCRSGKEYNGQFTTGWKKGKPEGRPSIKLGDNKRVRNSNHWVNLVRILKKYVVIFISIFRIFPSNKRKTD